MEGPISEFRTFCPLAHAKLIQTGQLYHQPTEWISMCVELHCQLTSRAGWSIRNLEAKILNFPFSWASSWTTAVLIKACMHMLRYNSAFYVRIITWRPSFLQVGLGRGKLQSSQERTWAHKSEPHNWGKRIHQAQAITMEGAIVVHLWNIMVIHPCHAYGQWD